MKKNLPVCLAVFAFLSTGNAQTCKVLAPGLVGSYEGECKSDKAHGKGKAQGEDSYEGEFRSGYPDGTGKYTWKNKDWFLGAWKKGSREGQGEMHYLRADGSDSTVTGFWKKDRYIGKYEKPYAIIAQSSKISSVRVNNNNSNSINQVSINIQSLSGGASTMNGMIQKMKISSVDILKGSYLRQLDIDNQLKISRSVFSGVLYPFRAVFRIAGSESVEIEFFEAGNWEIDVNILN